MSLTHGELCELAERFGTPAFVYDVRDFRARLAAVREALGPKVRLCYAMKANPFLAAEAVAGAGDDAAAGQTGGFADALEVCSPGELETCASLGVGVARIVYSGVNKQPGDIERAVTLGAGTLTAESLLHLDFEEEVCATLGTTADVLLRLNANSQFGMSREDLTWAVDQQMASEPRWPHLRFVGLHYFVGTQRRKLRHQERELAKLTALLDSLREDHGWEAARLEYGPGLAVPYFTDEDHGNTLAPARELAPMLAELASRMEVTVELGRFLAAGCGTYLTRAMDLKENRGTSYCILDGGINQLTYAGQTMGMHVPRLANVTAVSRADRAGEKGEQGGEARAWCLCGSLCSVNDVLVRNVELPSLERGDVLAFFDAGAYAATEGIGLFLSRDLPRIVMVGMDGEARLVRELTPTHPFNTPRS